MTEEMINLHTDISNDKDIIDLDCQLQESVKNAMNIHEQHHENSIKLIQNIEEVLQGINEKHVKALRDITLNKEDVNCSNEAVYSITNIPVDNYNSSMVVCQVDDDKRAYIEKLELKVRKYKMKLKHFKESMNAHSSKKLEELESKIQVLVSDHSIQEILKDKGGSNGGAIINTNVDDGVGGSMNTNSPGNMKQGQHYSSHSNNNNNNNNTRIKSPMTTGTAVATGIIYEDVNEMNHLSVRLSERGLDELFNKDIAKDVFLEENERLKKEQCDLKIFIEYICEFNQKCVNQLCKLIMKNTEISHRIMASGPSSISNSNLNSQNQLTLSNRKAFDAITETQIKEKQQEQGQQQQQHTKNESFESDTFSIMKNKEHMVLGWINTELRKVNEEFLEFEEDVDILTQQRMSLINPQVHNDEFLGTFLSKTSTLTEKLLAIRMQFNMDNPNNNHLNSHDHEAPHLITINHSDYDQRLEYYNQRLKELEEENKDLKEQLKLFKKNQVALNSNIYKARKSPSTHNIGSIIHQEEYGYGEGSHMENPIMKMLTTNTTTSMKHMRTMETPDKGVRKSISSGNRQNVQWEDATPYYGLNNPNGYIPEFMITKAIPTKEFSNKKSSSNNDGHIRIKKTKNELKEAKRLLTANYKNSIRLLHRLIDIISEYGHTAYETIKLIAFHKKKEVVDLIKNMMLNIQNTIKEYKEKHKEVVKNKSGPDGDIHTDDEIIHKLMLSNTMFMTFEETMNNLLDYYDHLKELKTNYYTHHENKNGSGNENGLIKKQGSSKQRH